MKWWFRRRREASPPLTFYNYQLVVEPLVRMLLEERGGYVDTAVIDTILWQLWCNREEPNFKRRLRDLVIMHALDPNCYPPLVLP